MKHREELLPLPGWMVPGLVMTGVVVGLHQLAAWLTGSAQASIAEGRVVMKANAALGLVSAGLALGLLVWSRDRAGRAIRVVVVVARVLAAFGVVVGALTIAEYLGGRDLGIDQWIAVEPPGAAMTQSPNRMPLPAAGILVLVCLGVLGLSWRCEGAVAVLGLLVCLLCFVPAVGLVCGVTDLYRASGLTGLASSGVLAWSALGTALVLSVPNRAPFRRVLARDAGGEVLRRVLPMVIVGLPLLGRWRVMAEREGWIDGGLATGLMIVASVVFVCGVLWWVAGRLSRSAATAARAEEAVAAAQDLAEREQRLLSAVFEALPVAVVITDRQGGILRTNGRDREVWGERPATRAVADYGQYRAWWVETGRPVRAEEWASAVAVQRGESVTGQWLEIERSDGERRHILNSASPVRAADGSIVGSAVVIQDVTAWRESEQRLGVALDGTAVGMFEWRLPSGDLLWNRQLEVIFGLAGSGGQPTALTQRYRYPDWAERVHPEDLPRVLEETERCRLARSPLDCDYRIVRPDGGVRWVTARGMFHYDGRGEAHRFLGIVLDVTERREAAEALREAHAVLERRVAERTRDLEAMVMRLQEEAGRRRKAGEELERAHGELGRRSQQLRSLVLQLARAEELERRRVAQVLHDDVQQLLASLRLHIRFILEERDRTEAEEAARAATRIVDEALQATRNLTGELSPAALRSSDLAEAIRWLARWMQERHQLRVTVRGDRAITHRRDVRELVFGCARELLFNVVKHALVRTAEIEVSRDGDRVSLVVSDGGAGFDPRTLDQPRQDGGFGLFSVRERVELCGGRFEVRSSGGLGTRVAITVPCDSADSASLEEALPEGGDALAGAGGTGDGPELRVAVVDDHDVARATIREALERHAGLRVVGEAASGRAALEMVRQVRPDVVIMDYHLPDISGVEATRRIRAEFGGTQVIGISMHDPAECREVMRGAGAIGFVSKAAPVEDLIAAVRAGVGAGAVRTSCS